MSTIQRASDGTAYTVSGPEGAPLVALIHGLGLCRQVFDGVLPDLASFRLLAYDLYGHGESGPLPEGKTASLSLYADQLAGLLDIIRAPRAHVVGFSIGGMINRRFALDYPDRVASLVILNSPHYRGAGQDAVEDRAKTVRDQGAMATMDSALRRWFRAAYLEKGEGARRVQDWRSRVHAESYAQAAWVLAHGVRELIAPDPPIRAPTLVMTCENDTGSTPAMSEAIAGEIAGADVQIVPDLQHLGLMEDPHQFGAPIRGFLEGQR